MATALGINNPNSLYNRNERQHALHRSAAKAPAMFTITAYADKIAGRYEAMLTLIQGAKSFDIRLAAKGERIASEYETQLTMLAQYADDLAEAGITA
jgi:hypothetical protein